MGTLRTSAAKRTKTTRWRIVGVNLGAVHSGQIHVCLGLFGAKHAALTIMFVCLLARAHAPPTTIDMRKSDLNTQYAANTRKQR